VYLSTDAYTYTLDSICSSDLIKVGENAVKDLPVSALDYECEREIRDYCALSNLYLYYGLPVRAEYTLRHIVKLRTENVLFGPGHDETVMHLKLLKKSLKMQHKYKSALSVTKRISRAGEYHSISYCHVSFIMLISYFPSF
jgi:hypothetical protein